MDTLKATNKLIEAGLERKMAEATVKVIDDKNQELTGNSNKNNELISKNEIRLLFVGLCAAMAYSFVLLNTIISKLG